MKHSKIHANSNKENKVWGMLEHARERKEMNKYVRARSFVL